MVLGRALGGIGKSVERFVKRTLRLAGLALAGVVITILGVAFLAIGAVNWLALLMPSWLAWLIVGIVLFLLGLALALLTLLSLRS